MAGSGKDTSQTAHSCGLAAVLLIGDASCWRPTESGMHACQACFQEQAESAHQHLVVQLHTLDAAIELGLRPGALSFHLHQIQRQVEQLVL